MGAPDFSRLYAFTGPHEGAIPHLYVCTAGRTTVGVGCVVTAAQACALPFVHAATGAPATPAEILAAYRAVSAMPRGLVASAYSPACAGLVLPAATVRQLFDRRAAETVSQLTHAFPDFAGWPASAQIAAFDWGFNAGVGALTATEHFAPALRAHNWAAAATACHRAGDDGTPEHPTDHGRRNAETRALLLQAAGVPR